MLRLCCFLILITLLIPVLPIVNAPQQSTHSTLDDVFLRMASRIQGFAGFYYENSTLVINLARPADSMAVQEAIIFSQLLTEVDVEVLSDFVAGNYRTNLVEYSFTQLAQWRNMVMENTDLRGIITALDIDEYNNRLFIGVGSEDQISFVENVLTSLGIPRKAFKVELLIIEPLVNLEDRVRPIIGGLQISWPLTPPYIGLCTLGFVAIRAGVPGYVTNDHCTNVWPGVVDGINHYQNLPTAGNLIGIETVDPPFFSCLGYSKCRRSDAAFVAFNTSVPYSLGKIARTAGLGSLTIVGEWTIVDEASFHYVGTVLNKVGRTTGWTQGSVTNTCVHTGVYGHPDVLRLCQTFVSAHSAGGDSGSPVFEIIDYSSGTVRLHGVLWGGGDGVFVFSPITNIEQEMGPLETFPTTPTITVVSPNGGETWMIGETRQIQWTSQHLSGNVDILISRDNGSTWTTLFTNTANDGSDSWVVSGPPTNNAKIRIRSSTNQSIYDDSDGVFSIVFTLTVTSPNGGETWNVGTMQTITWNSQPYGTVKILLSRDGGSNWETIVASTPNDGSHQWLVSGAPTTNALIEIRSNEFPSVYDRSNGFFTIMDNVPPTVRVITPNGGEVLRAGRIYTIRWSVSDPGGIAKVLIHYSANGGSNWSLVADINGNPGFFRWRVPSTPSHQALVKITVYDRSGNLGVDQSDRPFRIR